MHFTIEIITIHHTIKIRNEASRPRNTRNSSGDEIANVNFLYDDIEHAVKIQ